MTATVGSCIRSYPKWPRQITHCSSTRTSGTFLDMAGGRSNSQGADSFTSTEMSRRSVLRWSGTAGIIAVGASVVAGCAADIPESAGADANGVVTLPGFVSRKIAVAGEPVAGTGFEFRAFPDGAATFVDKAVPGGWYLAVNHEIPGAGGVSSIRFAPDGTIVDAFSICADTGLNCAGGATPWGTWLTGEEFDWGHIWECDPTGAKSAVRLRSMGGFCHEAAAVAKDDRVYLTEDRPDGGFYRFTPETPGDLSKGLLEIATGAESKGPVTWVKVPNPDPGILQTLCRNQVPNTMSFSGGEGIATLGDLVWFSTKRDERIWQYDLRTESVELRYQAGGSSALSGVDNLWIDTRSEALFVAEDGGNMEVVMLRPDNTLLPVVQLPGQDISEITGPCFSPDGQRLYFSSQRAPVGDLGLPLGITYEVTGPFDDLLGRTA